MDRDSAPLEADSNALLSPLSPGEALLNTAPSECGADSHRVSFANPLTRPATPSLRSSSPAPPARRKRKASLTSFPDFLQNLLRSSEGEAEGLRDSESEKSVLRYLRETLSDGSWPSPRNGHLTDGGPSPRNVHVTDAGPSPRNGHLTDGGGDPPSGSRSLAHSSGDERSERASQTSVHLSRPATISITQRPRGNVFRKDTRLTSPFVVQINLPPGTRPVGEVHARMVTDGGRGSVLLASVAPQFSSAFGGDSFSSASVQLYATFELVRLHTGSHNNPAHICFDMAYIDSIGATHTVTSEPSAPFIVCTHSTQLVSAAGHLLRSTAFKSDSCLPWPAFSTLLRVHFTEAALLDRPPADADLEYIHERLNRAPLITVPEFNRLWDNWLGLVLKALTQRPGRAMWDSGLIAGLVPPERAARTLTAGTAVFGFHSATAELVAVFNPLTGGGPIRTCTNTDKRCVVDAVISDAAADTVWIAQRKTTVPKRKAERLAGLSPRRAAAKERRKGKRRSRNDTDSDSD